MTGEPAPPRVLVVEDDPDVSDVLASLLGGAGYAVEAVDSAIGTEAIVGRSRPDVILLDLGLPYRSGGSLLEALKADPATAGVPVVVVSAIAEILIGHRRALAHAVIAKPFAADELLETVADACRG